MKYIEIVFNLNLSEFNDALKHAIDTWDVFGKTLSRIKLTFGRQRTSAGEWAFQIARFCGFLPHEINAWLETCPGAYQDEFREGWER